MNCFHLHCHLYGFIYSNFQFLFLHLFETIFSILVITSTTVTFMLHYIMQDKNIYWSVHFLSYLLWGLLWNSKIHYLAYFLIYCYHLLFDWVPHLNLSLRGFYVLLSWKQILVCALVYMIKMHLLAQFPVNYFPCLVMFLG